jgi:hypothetical protein
VKEIIMNARVSESSPLGDGGEKAEIAECIFKRVKGTTQTISSAFPMSNQTSSSLH